MALPAVCICSRDDGQPAGKSSGGHLRIRGARSSAEPEEKASDIQSVLMCAMSHSPFLKPPAVRVLWRRGCRSIGTAPNARSHPVSWQKASHIFCTADSKGSNFLTAILRQALRSCMLLLPVIDQVFHDRFAVFAELRRSF